MTRFKHFSVLLIFLSWCNFITGQTKDAELWTGIEISKRITKKITVKLEEQVRINDNISSVKSVFADLGVSYRFNKNFKISGNYRFVNRGSNTGVYWVAHRFYADFRYTYKAKPLIFIYRNRFYTENGHGEDGSSRENYERNKLELKFDLDKKFSPFIASELYYFLDKSELRKIRYTAGVDFDLKNRNEFSLFYRIQREINVKTPDYSYIIGVGFSHNLKGRLIKKKAKAQGSSE